MQNEYSKVTSRYNNLSFIEKKKKEQKRLLEAYEEGYEESNYQGSHPIAVASTYFKNWHAGKNFKRKIKQSMPFYMEYNTFRKKHVSATCDEPTLEYLQQQLGCS